MSSVPESEEHDRWRFRRRMVFGSAGFLAAALVLLIVFGDPNNAIQKEAAGNVGWWLLGVVGVYIGAPVADDWLQKNKGRHDA